MKNKDLRTYLLPIVLIGILSIIGGVGTVAIKFAAHAIPPFALIFIRFVIASSVLVPLLLWKEQRIRFPPLRLIIVAGFGLINIIFFVIGIPYTNAAVSQVLYALVPVLATILSFYILKEFPSQQRVIGILVGFFGALFIAVLSPNSLINNLHSAKWGNAIIFVGVIAQAFFTVGTKPFQGKFSALYTTTILALLGVCVSAIPAFVELRNISDSVAVFTVPVVVSVLYSGLISTIIYYYVYQQIVFIGSPVLASITLYLQPVTAYFVGSAVFGETLNIEALIAGVVTVVGACLVMFDRDRKPT